VLLTLFHWLRTALVYLVMLAVMTYITGLFYAVVSGWVLGKSLLSWVSAFYLPGRSKEDYQLADVELL
jgi:hypothetical protein